MCNPHPCPRGSRRGSPLRSPRRSPLGSLRVSPLGSHRVSRTVFHRGNLLLSHRRPTPRANLLLRHQWAPSSPLHRHRHLHPHQAYPRPLPAAASRRRCPLLNQVQYPLQGQRPHRLLYPLAGPVTPRRCPRATPRPCPLCSHRLLPQRRLPCVPLRVRLPCLRSTPCLMMTGSMCH
jgi:hypothetical protein